MTDGVSVVVCCHNSSKRLGPTIAHLAAQRETSGIPWEVLVVDNASTDGTAAVARATWPPDAPAPMRVVAEPRTGLSYARQRGFAESSYDLVSFIDDDNWVCPDWVRLVFEVMETHSEVGACGGLNEPICEVPPPAWIAHYWLSYAVGPQGREAGDVTEGRGWLFGAGLTLRRSAWRSLVDKGFRSVLPDRQGTRLTSGGDIEMCLALRLAGWRLWYEPRLTLRHYLPATRLSWSYLRRLTRAACAATVWFDAYDAALRPTAPGLKGRLRRTWPWMSAHALKNVLQYGSKSGLSLLSSSEGDANLHQMDYHLGRLSALLRQRGAYNRRFRDIECAGWRRRDGTSSASHASLLTHVGRQR